MSDELDLVQRLQNACNDYEADLLENAFVTIIEARFLEAAEEITRLRASIALKDKAPMSAEALKYIEQADELYSAVAEAIQVGFITTRLKHNRDDFAIVCNAWKDHPAKIADRARASTIAEALKE